MLGDGHEFNRFLGSATAVNAHGIEIVLKELKGLERRMSGKEPKLALPSSVPSISVPE